MKDGRDEKTIDAFPGAQKKRGRPSTGKAMTAAERKAKSRKEGRRKIWKNDYENLKDVPITTLLEELSVSITSGHTSIAKKITEELIKRSEEKAREINNCS